MTAALVLDCAGLRCPLPVIRLAQHIADVYIAARTLHLATLSACWRLDGGLDAGPDLDVAAYWLAEYGPVAARTCHHLHGGMGMGPGHGMGMGKGAPPPSQPTPPPKP